MRVQPLLLQSLLRFTQAVQKADVALLHLLSGLTECCLLYAKLAKLTANAAVSLANLTK